MVHINQKIGFIGAGNMGQAMIAALIRSSVAEPSQIFIHEIRKDQADALKNKYSITALTGNENIIQSCDAIIFAVKPQAIDQVLSELAKKNVFQQINGRKVIISIIAGKKIKKFEDYIYASLDKKQKRLIPILRVMPNTPAVIGEGMSGLCANTFADDKDIKLAKTMLLAMGKVLECEEKDMDAVTALSGSGPAYCFYIVEAMIEAGVKMGFTPDSAAALTVTTLKGALSLLEHQQESPEQLRRKVTSPGGTTEAAIKLLEDNGFKKLIISAIQAAARRSKELSA